MREWYVHNSEGLEWHFSIRPVAGEWALKVQRVGGSPRQLVRLFDREGDADDHADILMYLFGLIPTPTEEQHAIRFGG